jgi:hypothetical protein
MFKNNFLIHKIIGQKLEKIFWVWDNNEDEWVKDCPVVLKLSDGVVTLCSNKHSDFSMGWNNIDLKDKPVPYGCKNTSLEWREFHSRGFDRVSNRRVESVEVINFLPTYIEDFPVFDLAEARIIKKLGFLHGVGFSFYGTSISVLNGLYDNNIVFFEDEFPSYYTRIIINKSSKVL